MKIFGWAADQDGCFWYRIKLPLDALAARGHTVEYGTRMPAWAREDADVLVAQRTCMPGQSAVFQKIAAQGKIRTVYEIDDDLFTIDPRHNPHAAVFHLPEVRESLIGNLRAAHLVTVTTERLAEIAGRYNGNVAILPNYVPAKVLETPITRRRHAPGDGLHFLGWGGSPTHNADWEAARASIAQLMAEDPNVKMLFLGVGHLRGLPPLQVGALKWTSDMMIHYGRLNRFDIGLAPLVKTNFNDSKSAIKVVEYMSMGVPPVASHVTAYQDTIVNGVNGFLARKPADWYRILRELANDPQLREMVGRSARHSALAWTIEGNAHRWEQAYAKLL